MLSKQYKFEVKSLNGKGIIAGYGSVFDVVDLQNDVIKQGAFKESIAENERANNMPKMLWQHQHDSPIGIWQHIEEDSKGLYVEGKLLLNIPLGAQAFELLQNQSINGLSIGFQIQEAFRNQNSNYREITKLKLFEISVVTFAANPQAQIMNVKNSNVANKPHPFTISKQIDKKLD